VTRLLLHPIVWVYILDRRARQHSARYLARALGRPATWGDVYRHLHTFSATVLDRAYLLQERFDLFRFEASGVEAILEPFGRGEGVLAFGAHLGSFEALRTIGHEKGLRVAMIMYGDNARLINETLAALAPRAELHTIALGRIDAMLSIRRWLDEGGVAGLLADRSLPGNSQRSKGGRVLLSSANRRTSPTARSGSPPCCGEGSFSWPASTEEAATTICASSSSPTSATFPAAAGPGSATQRCAPRCSATCRRSKPCAAKRPTTGSTSTTSGPMPRRRPHPARRRERRPLLAATIAALGLAATLALAPAPRWRKRSTSVR
jgi:hypothetical protein